MATSQREENWNKIQTKKYTYKPIKRHIRIFIKTYTWENRRHHDSDGHDDGDDNDNQTSTLIIIIFTVQILHNMADGSPVYALRSLYVYSRVYPNRIVHRAYTHTLHRDSRECSVSSKPIPPASSSSLIFVCNVFFERFVRPPPMCVQISESYGPCTLCWCLVAAVCSHRNITRIFLVRAMMKNLVCSASFAWLSHTLCTAANVPPPSSSFAAVATAVALCYYATHITRIEVNRELCVMVVGSDDRFGLTILALLWNPKWWTSIRFLLIDPNWHTYHT